MLLGTSFGALETAEAIDRSETCRAAFAGLSQLTVLAYEGMAFFATNERQRRTFFKLQEKMSVRQPDTNPDDEDWDFLFVPVSKWEWDRRNPYNVAKPPPGHDYSYTENPAQERVVAELRRLEELEKAVECVCVSPEVLRQRAHSELMVAEVRGRKAIVEAERREKPELLSHLLT
jgi:hypothetical protein